MNTDPILQPLKPRNVLAFVAAFGLTVGAALGHPALMAIGAATLAALVCGFLEARRWLNQVNVTRDHHPRAFQGSSVGVTLTLTSPDRNAPELLLVEDDFPPGATSRIRCLLEHPPGPEHSARVRFTGSCDHRRGLYVLGPVKLQATDSLGFFHREQVLDLFTELLVYPQSVSLESTGLLGDGVLERVGMENRDDAGAGEEFLGVRAWVPGDSPRRVHWPLSVRHQRLLVKEFQQDVTTMVSFFLDLGRLGLTGVGDQTSVEYGIKACSSLAKRANDLGHRFQFFGLGKEVEFLPPGSGVNHLLALLDRLALVRPEGESAFPVLFKDLSRDLPRGSTAVAILGATTVRLDDFAPLILQLVSRHILPILVLIDDRAFVKVFREQELSHVNAMPLEKLEKELVALGARVHLIRRAKTIPEALLVGLELSMDRRGHVTAGS